MPCASVGLLGNRGCFDGRGVSFGWAWEDIDVSRGAGDAYHSRSGDFNRSRPGNAYANRPNYFKRARTHDGNTQRADNDNLLETDSCDTRWSDNPDTFETHSDISP